MNRIVNKKLALNRETIRALTINEMADVAGGVHNPTLTSGNPTRTATSTILPPPTKTKVSRTCPIR
jgi:hypothetical protein